MAGRTPQAGAASGNGRSVQVYADDLYPGSESGLDTARRLVHADAYARHRRAGGDDVHFALALSAAGPEVDGLRARLESLAISCDWDRTVLSSDPRTHRALQLLFLALLERDLLYSHEPQPWERGASWFLRSSAYAEWCADGASRLGGTAKAAEAQRQALGRVEGVELTAAVLGLGDLTVFTPFADAVEGAKFVAISPRHPQIESIAPAQLLAALAKSRTQPPAVQSELQAAVPGVEGLLPLVITPAHEPLALASLGIPACDEAAGSIVAQLSKGGGLPLKTRDSRKPQAAVRYQLADLAVSEAASSGPPVPVVHCAACGAVAVPREELPVGPAAGEGPVPCPGCGGEAVRDSEVLAAAFQSMWSWLLLGPLADQAELGLGQPEPAQPPLVVSSSGGGARLLQQRIATNLFQQLRGAAEADDLVEAAAVVGSLEKHDPACEGAAAGLDQLIEQEGADVVRFALLDSAAVGTPSGLYTSSLRRAKRFLKELHDLSKPHLDAREGQPPPEVDRGSRARRRLVAWCAVAGEKVAEAFADLETSRVTHNLTLLFRRIQDFEEQAAADGEVSTEDREALAYAVSVLLALAAPCVPGIAAELGGGSDGRPVAVSGARSDAAGGGG